MWERLPLTCWSGFSRDGQRGATLRADVEHPHRAGLRALPFMTAEQALAFVREHGVVLVSAKGAAPRLTEAIAGAPIEGSWWSHPQGKRIFRVLREVTDADEVFVCRLVGGKVTLVHARVLPALVRLADDIPQERIARVREKHTPSGRHENEETPYPEWVTPELRAAARALSKSDARRMLPGLDL